mgnify:CR=1 FL=1
MNEARANRILAALKEQGVDQMLITDPMSICYLTGISMAPIERFFFLCPGSWMKNLLRRSGFRTGCQDAQGDRCHSVQGGRSYDHAPSGVWDGGPAPASGCGL